MGDLGGKSASLACFRTLARIVELWGVRADVWEGVWRGLGGFGDSGGSGMSQNASKDCGDVGSPSSCVLGIWGRSGCSETIQGLWNCGGSERGSGTTTPYKPPADSSTPPGRLAGGSGLSNLSRSRG